MPDAVIQINAGTRTGYTFAGWTASPSGAGTFANASAVSTTFTMPNQNVHITANWTEDTPLITAPTITTTVLPSGRVGQAYTSQLIATGSVPITWSISSGNLPTGLTLNTATGAITGTPASTGTFNFTVTATNTAGANQQNLSIVINAATVTLPPPQHPYAPDLWDSWSATPQATIVNRSQPFQIPVNADAMQIDIQVLNRRATFRIPEAVAIEIVGMSEDIITFDLSDFETVNTAIISLSAIRRFIDAGNGVEIIFAHGALTIDTYALYSIARQATGNISIMLELMPPPQMYRVIITSVSRRIDVTNGISVSLANDMAPQLYDDPPQADTIPAQITLQPAITLTATLRLSIGSATFTHMGEMMQSDAVPFIDAETNRTMVPLRIIAEGLGAEVSFDDTTRTVYIQGNGTQISLTIDVPLPDGLGTPVIVDGRTFVPARYISEILGAAVRWDNEARAVYVYS